MMIRPREDDLVLATFGRSLWVIDDIKPLRTLASDKKMLQKMEDEETASLEIFQPPVAYQPAFQQLTGNRFDADAIFNGEEQGFWSQNPLFLKTYKSAENTRKHGENSQKHG